MLRRYIIPPDVFADLARGHGGARAGRWLAGAEQSKHMLLVRGVLYAAAAVNHEQAAEARSGYHNLSAIQQRIPDVVNRVIRQPAVGAWAVETIQRIHRNENVRDFPQHINSLVAAAAIRGNAPYTGILPIVDRAVVIPSVGRALFSERCKDKSATVQVTATGAEIITSTASVHIPLNPSDDADGWQGMRVLDVHSNGLRLRVIIDDIDPYRFPSSAGLSARLNPVEAQRWATVLEDAWTLLVRHHQRIAAEIMAIATTFTPLRRDALHMSNATSRATFGCVALSRPRDGLALALALAHEVQHAKLAALSDLKALVRPNTQQLYYAPWRDDPRPAEALLHGTYAHLGVAEFWRRQRYVDAGQRGNLMAHVEYVRWRDATVEAADTLRRCPDLTELGRDFVEGIGETLLTLRRDHVPSDAAELARTAAANHRLQWGRTHENQTGGRSKSMS